MWVYIASFVIFGYWGDGVMQETLLNLLLRNYLHYNLYDQAEKLRSKAPRFEAHSNQQVNCHHSYYVAICLLYFSGSNMWHVWFCLMGWRVGFLQLEYQVFRIHFGENYTNCARLNNQRRDINVTWECSFETSSNAMHFGLVFPPSCLRPINLSTSIC